MTSQQPLSITTEIEPSSMDLQYWDQFYVSHRSEFLKWAYKHYHLLPEEAVDVYQDAIVILYENATSGKLDHLQCSVKTYFFGIAKNLISTYLKKKIKEKEKYEKLPENLSLLESLAVTERNNDWMEYSIEVVGDAIKKLSGKGQAILHLFYYEKMSLKEITQVLGYKSEDVVKTTKMRYMKILREIIESEIQYS
ncbi:sigma-70 family RNA polymerase sigma factor [Xanthocytophaga agilis]|uniref:Sigma-70 family RNA polymerase sigma factor n=1 Tax=Xanthocytophaga agilis TaxID=3048010 RepID=A0AAE3UGX2_9BACT|nr:sigma-70 family RNA polymerase sigma factor [Xanthocytophaga agilis]MDJ1503746.1 sigma-70 family RNA polymerase sigma factor [Xanthocytophaga agilis]